MLLNLLLGLETIFIVTITTTILAATGYEYRILVLLPLSGQNQLEGNIIKAGVNVAWKEEVARLNTPHDIEVDIVYEDTQCSQVKEKDFILHHLADTVKSPGQLLVFSYNCYPSRNSSLAALGLLGVPVITFGSEVILNRNGIIGRQLVPGVFEILSQLLQRNNWTQVGIPLQTDNIVLRDILIQALQQRDIKILNTDFHPLTIQRIWILIGDPESIADTLCTIKDDSASNIVKFIWIVPTTKAFKTHTSILQKCGEFPGGSVILIEANKLDTKIPSYFTGKLREEGIHTSNHQQEVEAADTYDITRLVLGTLHKVVLTGRGEFGKRFYSELLNSKPFDGLTGYIEFDQFGVRRLPHTVYQTQGNLLDQIDEEILLDMGSSTAASETKLDGIPLWLLAFMSSLAILGMVYAIAIIVFNIAKAKNKIIKMTSPNLNIVMLIGAILGYGCIILLGLDTGYVDESTMEKLQTACVFVLALGFTIIYGCLFAKSWRVFLVFKNINFNGKLTRDEHLLIGILVMLLIDLGILLPWYFVDPINCTKRTISTIYEPDMLSTVTYQVDDCHSNLQGLWIALLYLYKLLLIIAGLYFTWQTRNITLPSLKDTKLIYIVVYTIVTTAIIALPTLLISYVGMKTRYATGGLIIWMVLTVTISVLFVPKIILERKSRDASGNISAFNFLFSESMRKTQEAVRKCSLCFCCGDASESDRYVQEMLANEIDTLKRTIKQKDASIRELNDRLYIGTEKFQEYLTAPKSNRSVLHAMQEKYESRKNRHPQQPKQLSHENNIGNNETNNEITIHCPKPVNASANGFVPNHLPHTFTSNPHKTTHDLDNQNYEDEGIHSSDSYPQQTNANVPYRQEHPPGETDKHFTPNHHNQHQQNTYKPIQTVSNGYIPTRSNSAVQYSHTRNHSQVSMNIGSQRSLHNPNHYQQKMQPQNSYKLQEWRPPSPNQDSAFDDNTPSSDGYDKYPADKGYCSGNTNMKQEYDTYTDFASSMGGGGIAEERQFSQIDIGAMEYDAVRNFQRTPSLGRQYESFNNDLPVSPYYHNSNTMPRTKMSVSQI